MIEYNFQIDKGACFAYWAQSLVKWVWYFDKKELEYYSAIFGTLTDHEQNALEELKRFLQKENTGYLWLWGRYSGKKLKDEEELEVWRDIQKTLKNKFEMIWKEEFPKLEEWKRELEKYDFNKLNKMFSKISDFFGIDKGADKNITVKLFLNYQKEFGRGHAKKEFKDLIVLPVSNVDKKYTDNIINMLVHEIIHIIEYESNKSKLLKKSYEKIIKPKGFKAFLQSIKSVFIKRKGPAWRHLLVESVISTIAGVSSDYNYFQHILFNDSNKLEKFKSMKFSYKKSKDNYARQIRAVASRLIDTTIEYLDNNKEMDEAYGDKVAKAWLDFRKS